MWHLSQSEVWRQKPHKCCSELNLAVCMSLWFIRNWVISAAVWSQSLVFPLVASGPFGSPQTRPLGSFLTPWYWGVWRLSPLKTAALGSVCYLTCELYAWKMTKCTFLKARNVFSVNLRNESTSSHFQQGFPEAMSAALSAELSHCPSSVWDSFLESCLLGVLGQNRLCHTHISHA